MAQDTWFLRDHSKNNRCTYHSSRAHCVVLTQAAIAYCGNYGTFVADSSAFCGNCGHPIRNNATTSQPASPNQSCAHKVEGRPSG